MNSILENISGNVNCMTFPMQVEKVLVQFPELGSNYLITLETVNNRFPPGL